MSTSLPRLHLSTRAGDPDAVSAFAVGIVRAARAAGLEVGVLAVGSNRDVPAAAALEQLRMAAGREVHRVDPGLMPTPAIQGLALRIGGTLDLILVLSSEPLGEGGAPAPQDADVAAALLAPVVLCVDAEDPLFTGQSMVRIACEGVLALAPSMGAPLPWLSEAEGGRRAPAIEAALGTHVLSTPPRSSRGGRVQVASGDLASLMDHARRAAPLPPPVVHRRSRTTQTVRARVGVVIDRCFDLQDEDGLVQFEVSGADLVPLSVLEDDEAAFEGLDGLIIGDGRTEEFSSSLARATGARRAVRSLVEAGVPTLACGGGLAYLTRGLRTVSGALHPLAGVIDAEASARAGGRPEQGHAEVELLLESLIGPTGTRLRGFVQRSWRLRGVPRGEAGLYRTLSGPPDEGVGRQGLFGTHLRPYWPSCPGATAAFVDRCVTFAAARDRGAEAPGHQ